MVCHCVEHGTGGAGISFCGRHVGGPGEIVAGGVRGDDVPGF